jgi:hypothetical protein
MSIPCNLFGDGAIGEYIASFFSREVHEPVYFNKSSFKKMSHKYNVEEM